MVKIGPAFGDYVRLEKSQKHPGDFRRNYSVRNYLLPAILIIGVIIIITRLFFLQIIEGKNYRELSDSNRTKTIPIHAPRGIIFDRGGIPLVFNVPGFREIVGEKTRLISKDDALKLLSGGKSNLEIDSLRNYPYKDVTAHVLGYIGQISKEELEEKDFLNYNGGDLIGKIGIEKEYEKFLNGVNGKELVEIDSLGKVVRKLGQADPVPGRNITLTLDIALQKAVYDGAKDIRRGAVIVSNPTGEILALISKPSFDPNLFTMGEGYSSGDSTVYKSISQILLDSEGQPLLNRAIGGVYPPGSTFKLVTAAAGLEDKVIDKNFTIEDTGVLRIGAFSFSNWYFTQYGRTDGEVNVAKAIQRSNDIFFYKLAELVGVDKLSIFAEKFGLGKKLGIDLSGELSGTIPTREWKKNVIGENWYLGDTYHYGIGQGFLLTTPLQVNIWTQAIANRGLIYKPHLLRIQNPKPNAQKFLSDNTANLIREGMVEACSAGGVAWPLFNFKVKGKPVSVACKTGTAQYGGEEALPHAWITLFAPSENPQIIVTVLSEESGEGSNIAAPIAKKILEEWFGR
jgi:penicillin-binding protein 2